MVAAQQTFTLRASAAQTVGTVTGTATTGMGHYKRYIVLLDITASATEAGDTLDVYIDVSPDGTAWLNAIHFTQKAGNTVAIKEYAVLDATNPGAVVIDVTADAASGVTRPSIFGSQVRCRSVVVEANANANSSHTFSVVAFAQ